MSTEAKEKALEIIADISGADRASLNRDMDLAGDLGIDSPKALQLLVDLEDALGSEISDEDAAMMESVGDILDYIDNLG